jgi:hypothetical protein
MTYSVTYHRHDKKIIETKPVILTQSEIDAGVKNPISMRQAVEIILNRATKAGVQISRIACTVEGSQGVQRLCEECLCTPANFGFKGNVIYCKECKE